jgi:CDP-diacylglycerol--glycerol-3-phosphate 3-phosphatidyltransferase
LVSLVLESYCKILKPVGYYSQCCHLVWFSGDNWRSDSNRLRNEVSDWGAFVDSVTDRYSELFIFCGFLIYYLLEGNPYGSIFAYLAAAGSVLVSYVKARAEASKLDANVGLLTRVERYIVLIPGLIFNQPFVVVIIIAIFANFTAIQRILRVRADAHRNNKFPKRRVL